MLDRVYHIGTCFSTIFSLSNAAGNILVMHFPADML